VAFAGVGCAVQMRWTLSGLHEKRSPIDLLIGLGPIVLTTNMAHTKNASLISDIIWCHHHSERSWSHTCCRPLTRGITQHKQYASSFCIYSTTLCVVGIEPISRCVHQVQPSSNREEEGKKGMRVCSFFVIPKKKGGRVLTVFIPFQHMKRICMPQLMLVYNGPESDKA